MILRALLLGAGALGVTAGVAHAISSSRGRDLPPKPIAPPGRPQPAGSIAIPHPPASLASGASATDPLHLAARVLLTKLSGMTPTKASFPECRAFQSSYNAGNPQTPLLPDGKYGGKCAAALQSVIAPAQAPVSFFPEGNAPVSQGGGPTKVAPPPVQAAQATPGLTLAQAASVLAGAPPATLTKSSDPRVRAFQNLFNATPGVLKLAPDGKYGGSTEGALQSVLNFLNGGLQAPANPFGSVAYVGSAPVYPPGREGDPTLASLGALASAQGLTALQDQLGY